MSITNSVSLNAKRIQIYQVRRNSSNVSLSTWTAEWVLLCKKALFVCFLRCLLLLLLLVSHFSRVRLCATPWMTAHQAPPSLGFSRQEHWSGLPFPSLMRESEVAQSCPTLQPQGYTVLGILQARILEWVVLPFSRGSSQPRDQIQVSHIAGWILYQLSHKGSLRNHLETKEHWVSLPSSSHIGLFLEKRKKYIAAVVQVNTSTGKNTMIQTIEGKDQKF